MKTFIACLKLSKEDDSSLEQMFGHKKKKKKEDSRNDVCPDTGPFVKGAAPSPLPTDSAHCINGEPTAT